MVAKKTYLADSVYEAFDKMYQQGLSIVKIAKVAGVGRMSVWRAANCPERLTIATAQKIINAIDKLPTMPFEFRKPQGD